MLNEYSMEKELLERALEKEEKHDGRQHFEMTTTLNNMEQRLRKARRPHKLEELFEHTVEILEQHYGETHFEVAKTFHNLTLAHSVLGDRGNEVQILFKNLPTFERHFGIHHEYCVLMKMVIRNAE